MTRDAEWVLRKLRPLKPRDVEHWQSVRATASPDLRALLDRQALSSARAVLGDWDSQLLLSLPPENKAPGDRALGRIH